VHGGELGAGVGTLLVTLSVWWSPKGMLRRLGRTVGGSAKGGLAVFVRQGAFGLARMVTIIACPLPALFLGVPALLTQGVGVVGVQVRGSPGGPAAQDPCLELGEGQESIDPEQDYRCDDDVLPPHCESPLAEDVLAVLPEVAVLCMPR